MLSIIMPCYNQAQYIDEAIQSVVRQTYKDWELIIVDDGSTDDSFSIAKRYAQSDSRIQVHSQENGGPSKARNNGARLAIGKYLLFFDSDDIILPTLLEEGIRYMEDNENCALFYPRVRYFGSRNEEEKLRFTSYKNMLCEASILCTSIIRKTDYERIGGFDESMRGYEDWEMFIRLLYHNDFVCQSENILFKYRIHRHEGSVNLQAIRRSKEIMEYIYDKNRAIYDEYFGNPIHSIQQANYLQQEIDKLLTSRKYSIGCFIANPWRMIKKWFKG